MFMFFTFYAIILDFLAHSNGSASPSKEGSPEKSEEDQGNQEHGEEEEALIPDALKLKASRKADDNDNDMHPDHGM